MDDKQWRASRANDAQQDWSDIRTERRNLGQQYPAPLNGTGTRLRSQSDNVSNDEQWSWGQRTSSTAPRAIKEPVPSLKPLTDQLDRAAARLRTLATLQPNGRPMMDDSLSPQKSNSAYDFRFDGRSRPQPPSGNQVGLSNVSPRLSHQQNGENAGPISLHSSTRLRDEVWPLSIPSPSANRSPRYTNGRLSSPTSGGTVESRETSTLHSDPQKQERGSERFGQVDHIGLESRSRSQSTSPRSDLDSDNQRGDAWNEFSPGPREPERVVRKTLSKYSYDKDGSPFQSPRATREIVKRDSQAQKFFDGGEDTIDTESSIPNGSVSPGAYFKQKTPPFSQWPTTESTSAVTLECNVGEVCSRSFHIQNESGSTAVLILEPEAVLDPQGPALCVFPAHTELGPGEKRAVEFVLHAGSKPSQNMFTVLVRDITTGWKTRIQLRAVCHPNTHSIERSCADGSYRSPIASSVQSVDFGTVDPVDGATMRIRLKNISSTDTFFLQAHVAQESVSNTFQVALRYLVDEILRPGAETELVVTMLPVPTADGPREYSCVVAIIADSIKSGILRKLLLPVKGTTTLLD